MCSQNTKYQDPQANTKIWEGIPTPASHREHDFMEDKSEILEAQQCFSSPIFYS